MYPKLSRGSSLFDVAELVWSTELVERYGIDPALLPEGPPAAGLAGAVTERAAKASGIRRAPPSWRWSDSTVESFAIGLDGPRSCKIRLGTSGAASTVVNDPDLAGRAYVWAYVRANRWMVDTNTRACGQSVRWLRDIAYSEITGMATRSRRSTPRRRRSLPAQTGCCSIPTCWGRMRPTGTRICGGPSWA